MRPLCRFFLIFILAYTVAGCSPIGSIGSEVDLLWAVPTHLEYTAGARFMPNNELQVFASCQGVVKSVSLNLVEISIAENPYIPNDLTKITLDKGYIMEKTGKKLIVVKYSGLDTSYSIEVLSSTATGNNPAGINVKWPDE